MRRSEVCGSPFSSFNLGPGDPTQGIQLDSKHLCPLSRLARSLIWPRWQTGSCQCTLAGPERPLYLEFTPVILLPQPPELLGSQGCAPEKPSPVTRPSLCLCPRGAICSAATSYPTFRPQQRWCQQHQYQQLRG